MSAGTLIVATSALLIEGGVGYSPRLYRWIGHPVTWIGALIARLDDRLNSTAFPSDMRRWAGFVAVLILLAASLLCGATIHALARTLLLPFSILAEAVVASSLLAQRSLHQHVAAVAAALDENGLAAGRRTVAMIVGRDTAPMDEAAVCRAAIESLAENFSDGVVAPLFWLVLAGLPGIIAYKAVNTADSMIGHRTERHQAFGFAAAKLDDAINWPAARLSGILLIAAATLTRGASARDAWRIMRRDSRGHPSPNAGWPEAAMAGALSIRLGGPRSYGGRTVKDRSMGDGTAVVGPEAIRLALRLFRLACLLQALAAAGLAVIFL